MQRSVILSLLVTSQLVCTTPLPSGVTVGLRPEALHPIQSLYHAQDNYGQYVYGYATPTSTKSETKTADGVTRGGYSYIDSHGHLQTVHYTADALNGFRVAATNLPKDLPEVVFERAKHIADYQAIKAEHEQIAALRAVPYSNPIAVPLHAVQGVPLDQQLPQPVTDLPEVVKARQEHLAALHAAYNKVPILPQPVHDLPEVVKARAEHLAAVEETKARDSILNDQVNLSPVPETIVGGVVPVRTAASQTRGLPVAQSAPVSYTPVVYHQGAEQYRDQDNWGQYSYGYVGPHSSHSESRSADGITRGGYSFIDANGVIQTVHYVADAVHGFRVAATNLPVDRNHARVTTLRQAAPAVRAPEIEPASRGKVIVKAVPSAELYAHEIIY